MDNATYDQLNVPSATLGDRSDYLVDSSTAVLLMYGDEIIGVDLSASVELTIAETEPGVQGDRVSGAKKPATLETGLVVQVPLFINPGETGQGRHPLGRVHLAGMSEDDAQAAVPPSVPTRRSAAVTRHASAPSTSSTRWR